MKKLLIIGVLATGQIAIAADVPPSPKPLVVSASEKLVKESGVMAARTIDVPIVRSSKGCIAYLGQTETGEVIVRSLYGKNGKPACRKEFAFAPGERAAGLDAPCEMNASDLAKAHPDAFGYPVAIKKNLCVDVNDFARLMVGDPLHWSVQELKDQDDKTTGWKIAPLAPASRTTIALGSADGSGTAPLIFNIMVER